MIKRLGHLCFKTDPIDRMMRFHRDVLGLQIEFTLAADDGVVDQDPDDNSIELME